MVPKRALAESTSLSDYIHDNYSQILKWARQITKNDEHASENLVQDLFLKSMELENSLVEVTRVESYVYRSLSNVHITTLRKRSRQPEVQVDNEFLHSFAHLAIDPRDSLAVRENLAEICYFACSRKQTSISASILLLRYFHGYFTAEVVRLLKRPRNSIESRLADARREVLAILQNRSRLERAMPAGDRVKKFPQHKADADFLQDLRNHIFSHTSGRCLSADRYRSIYSKQNLQPAREEIGHLVSCEACLRSINELLKLPQLEERHPLDTRGPKSAFDFFDHFRTRSSMLPNPDL